MASQVAEANTESMIVKQRGIQRPGALRAAGVGRPLPKIVPEMGPADPAAAAGRANLSYVSDAEPGIRRQGGPRRFRYVANGGEVVRDAETLARIRMLAIPPAWTHVWICASPDGHIQATGRDARGRKQYIYHADWIACRDEAKFTSLAAFAALLPKLRARVDADLRRRDLSRERVIATVVWLLDNAMIRIGNDVYARENKSFGLTTLRSRHVAIEGSRVRFAFVGKSGKEWKLRLADRRIAAIIRTVQELPGQRLFQYLDENGERGDIRSQDVNGYIKETIGDAFTSRHFRTWGATEAAATLLVQVPLPTTKRETNAAVNGIIDRVAHRLNNTRSVCRRSYIHPAVVDAWLEGRLADELVETRRRYPRPLKGLERDESTLLRWLSKRAQ
jgi:DNA topoisomerase-1